MHAYEPFRIFPFSLFFARLLLIFTTTTLLFHNVDELHNCLALLITITVFSISFSTEFSSNFCVERAVKHIMMTMTINGNFVGWNIFVCNIAFIRKIIFDTRNSSFLCKNGACINRANVLKIMCLLRKSFSSICSWRGKCIL